MAFDFRRIWWKNKEKHMLNHLAILEIRFILFTISHPEHKYDYDNIS
jgi:hypothetical protein